MIKIAPSILSANFGKLNEEIAEIQPYVDQLHIDVMDGHFVPNISFGAPVMRCVDTKLPMHVHLMISDPEKYFQDFVDANAASITFHIEAVSEPEDLIAKIKATGTQVGISLKPATPVSEIAHLLKDIDIVLIMTVEPGFGGQKFMPEMVHKIIEVKELQPDIEVQVDGGVNDTTVASVINAGGDTVIAGSYIFKSKNRIEAIKKLKI